MLAQLGRQMPLVLFEAESRAPLKGEEARLVPKGVEEGHRRPHDCQSLHQVVEAQGPFLSCQLVTCWRVMVHQPARHKRLGHERHFWGDTDAFKAYRKA